MNPRIVLPFLSILLIAADWPMHNPKSLNFTQFAADALVLTPFSAALYFAAQMR